VALLYLSIWNNFSPHSQGTLVLFKRLGEGDGGGQYIG